jgi:hypothetical protein
VVKNNKALGADKTVRKHLLKPLQRRPRHAFSGPALAAALEHLDERAAGELVLSETLKSMPKRGEGKPKESWKDPVAARRWIDFTKAMLKARRISHQEYCFYALYRVEGINDSRIMDGTYEFELGPIASAIDAIEKKYAQSTNDTLSNLDHEHRTLNRQYESVMDELLCDALVEFDLGDLVALKRNNPAELDRLRERGRRSVFHKDELKDALQDVVQRYEQDARRASGVGAYTAAITLLGAGLEGLLLLRCIKSKGKARRIAAVLPRKARPRNCNDLSSWRFETLIETCLAAGWLPPLASEVARYNPAGMAHSLRKMRNFVHPGKRATERPWIEAEQSDWKDAESIYLTLLSTVVKPRR